jgi:hypothetical protein
LLISSQLKPNPLRNKNRESVYTQRAFSPFTFNTKLNFRESPYSGPFLA